MLTFLVSIISNIQIFLLKMWAAFANAKATYISFSKNISVYAIYNDQNFNDTLTNGRKWFKEAWYSCFQILYDCAIVFCLYLNVQWNLDNSKSKGPNSFLSIIETLNNWGLKCIHIFQLGLQNNFELLRILNYWSLNYRGSTVNVLTHWNKILFKTTNDIVSFEHLGPVI